MNEIHHILCDFNVIKHTVLTEEERNVFLLNDRDVLFNRVNSYEWVGRTGLYKKQDKRDFVLAFYPVRFTPDQGRVLPEYLTLFLNTKYGVAEIRRRARHSVNQTNVNPEEVKAIAIPLLSKTFQERIKSHFDKAASDLVWAEKRCTAAETLLLDALGLANFKSNIEIINIKSLKESFGARGRLDAEYYQPKYEQFEKLVLSSIAGCTTITDEFTLVKTDTLRILGEFDYIEISDVNVGDGLAQLNKVLIHHLPANAKIEAKCGGLIVSKVRPNRGAVSIIERDDSRLVVSDAFTVLREKQNATMKKEALKVLLRLNIYREWLLKFNIGTQYPMIRDEDILNLPVPCIDATTQEKIATQIQESLKLKTESVRLLEAAKEPLKLRLRKVKRPHWNVLAL
jgi:type I restriction enzyme, S subunit